MLPQLHEQHRLLCLRLPAIYRQCVCVWVEVGWGGVGWGGMFLSVFAFVWLLADLAAAANGPLETGSQRFHACLYCVCSVSSRFETG